MVFLFFFSSRRRHTRWTGDWSSDVCSSDLRRLVVLRLNDFLAAVVAVRADMVAHVNFARARLDCERGRRQEIVRARSEERRVGKECRTGWWRGHEKKKELGVASSRVARRLA